MEFVTKPTIILSVVELGELYGANSPTYAEGLSAEDVRLFLRLEKYEYKDKQELQNALKRARNRIICVNKLLPKIEAKIEEVTNLRDNKSEAIMQIRNAHHI